MIKALKIFTLMCCLVCTMLYAEDRTAAVLIDPTIQSYDGLSSRNLSGKFFVDDVVDNRPNKPSDTLGITHTGKNSSAPLVSRLAPPLLVKNSIQGLFRELSLLTDERIDATYAIQAELLLFEITEQKTGMMQQMKAAVGYKVKIRRLSDNEVIRQFIVTGEDDRRGFNTTKYAESVASGALLNCLLRLTQDLSYLK